MSNVVYVIGAIIAIVLLVILWPHIFPPALQLEKITSDEPDPNTLDLEEGSTGNINFDVFSNQQKVWTNVKIIPKIAHNSGNYLQTGEVDVQNPILGQNGKSATEEMSFSSIGSEGSLLKYKIYLQLYANDSSVIMDNKTININIKPNSASIESQPSGLPQYIKLDSINPQSINLKEGGNSATITFNILCMKNGNYNNIKIMPSSVNSHKDYLQFTPSNISTGLTTTGQQIGSQTMQIQAIGSEGEELDYQVYLNLYSNNELMDSQPITVIITP